MELTGIEPATSTLPALRYSQLSYSPMEPNREFHPEAHVGRTLLPHIRDSTLMVAGTGSYRHSQDINPTRYFKEQKNLNS